MQIGKMYLIVFSACSTLLVYGSLPGYMVSYSWLEMKYYLEQ